MTEAPINTYLGSQVSNYFFTIYSSGLFKETEKPAHMKSDFELFFSVVHPNPDEYWLWWLASHNISHILQHLITRTRNGLRLHESAAGS
jgi:hypothetical protein